MLFNKIASSKRVFKSGIEMFSGKKMLRTGVYRANSRVSKFQCRLTFQKIHSLICVPVLDGLNDTMLHGDDDDHPKNVFKKIRNISWQEKVFSRYEIDYYRLKENCKSDRERMYHTRLKSQEGHDSDILFTYVEGDNFYPDDQDNLSQCHLWQSQGKNVESMYLMADLDEAVLLFSIHWLSDDGILIVHPDFNRITKNPYYHEVRGSNLQMYHYALEKCNTAEDQLLKTCGTLALFSDQTRTVVSLPREKSFVLPSKIQRHVLILLEIVYAEAFQYDGIHIRYQIKLNSGVSNGGGDDALSGSTHSSKGNNGFWHFGHCHELFLKIPDCGEAQQPCVDLFVEALSIDNFKRERHLGQSHFSIQLRPQKSELSVNFVQIIHRDTLTDRLEAFLVGNRRKINLGSFYGKNDTNILNRYGNKTRAAGKVIVRYQVVHQHQPKVLNHGLYKATRKSKNITLRELVASYKAARERLEEFVELKY